MTKSELLQNAKPILFNTEMVRAILDGRKTVTRRVIKPQPPEDAEIKFCNGMEVAIDEKADLWNGRQCSYKPPFLPYRILTGRGDILYVRETWQKKTMLGAAYFYKADEEINSLFEKVLGKWRPSIHMPKEAARIFLRVTGVRVERLQDITNENAVKEGIRRLFDDMSDEEYTRWASNRHKRDIRKDVWDWKNYLWHGHFGQYGTGSKLSDAWEHQYSCYVQPRDSFSSLWNSLLPLKEWNKYGWDANPFCWVVEFERISV